MGGVRRSKKDVILAAVVAVVIIVGMLWLLFSSLKKKDPIPDASSISASESDISAPESNIDSTSTNPTVAGKDFVLLTPPEGEPTMVGQGGYMDLDFFIEWGRSNIESSELTAARDPNGNPIILPTGHTMYRDKYDRMCIISGHSLIYVNDNVLLFDFLREETSGKRINVFPSVALLNDYEQRKEQGSAILSGDAEGEYGTIILDGAVTDITFSYKNGKYYFSLRDVMAEFVGSDLYNDGDPIFTIMPNEFNTFNLLMSQTSSTYAEVYEFNGSTYKFNSWNGKPFSMRISAFTNYKCEIDAVVASQILGWRIYTNESVLNIVTDEMNLSDNNVVYISGGQVTTKYRQDEDGVWWKEQYDTKGRLISSEMWVNYDVEGYIINDEESTDENGSSRTTNGYNEEIGGTV